jgi:hypothetical protein
MQFHWKIAKMAEPTDMSSRLCKYDSTAVFLMTNFFFLNGKSDFAQ